MACRSCSLGVMASAPTRNRSTGLHLCTRIAAQSILRMGQYQWRRSSLYPSPLLSVSHILSTRGSLVEGPIIGQKVGAQLLKIGCTSVSRYQSHFSVRAKSHNHTVPHLHHVTVDSWRESVSSQHEGSSSFRLVAVLLL